MSVGLDLAVQAVLGILAAVHGLEVPPIIQAAGLGLFLDLQVVLDTVGPHSQAAVKNLNKIPKICHVQTIIFFFDLIKN